MRFTNDMLLLIIGFFFGSFLYTVFFDVKEEDITVHCMDCAFYHPTVEDGICELQRETTKGQIVNVYCCEDEYCKYGVRNEMYKR